MVVFCGVVCSVFVFVSLHCVCVLGFGCLCLLCMPCLLGVFAFALDVFVFSLRLLVAFCVLCAPVANQYVSRSVPLC